LKPSLVRRLARLKRRLYRELLLKALKELTRLEDPLIVVDCGCGSAYEVAYGLSPSLSAVLSCRALTLLLLDMSRAAVKSAVELSKRSLEHPSVEVHGVVCDVFKLPLKLPLSGGTLGFYGSVLHELRSQGRLPEALAEASRYFKVVAGYEYVDPDPKGRLRLELNSLTSKVKRRLRLVAKEAGETLGRRPKLTLVLEACYQLGVAPKQPPRHLHFAFRAEDLKLALTSIGLAVKWFKLYDVNSEAELRLKRAGLALPLKEPLMGRAAWVAVKEGE